LSLAPCPFLFIPVPPLQHHFHSSWQDPSVITSPPPPRRSSLGTL
jgi:hypothetical protein